MIVPRLSLILLTSVTFIPLLGLAVSVPVMVLPAAVILGAVTLIAFVDAVRGVNRLKTIAIHLPAKLRWFQDRTARLELVFETRIPEAFRLRVGLGFPPELTPKEEEMTVDLPARAGRHDVLCECLPTRRGLFRIEGCHYEIASPCRLWDIRGRNAQPVEVRAYPNLEAERKHVAALFLRTNRVGMRAMRQVGQGRDFEKLREYVPGDGYDTIHWKSTARRGHPITKVYQVEKTQEGYVII